VQEYRGLTGKAPHKAPRARLHQGTPHKAPAQGSIADPYQPPKALPLTRIDAQVDDEDEPHPDAWTKEDFYGPIPDDSRLTPCVAGSAHAASSLRLPSERTPNYNRLLEKAAQCADPNVLQDLDRIFVTETRAEHHSGARNYERFDSYDSGIKYEKVLAITKEKRDQYIWRLRGNNDSRVWNEHDRDELIFEEEDMRQIMNAWKADWRSWSDKSKRTKPHGNFSTMLFQLLGSKALVQLLVKYPICTTRNPAELLRGLVRGMAAYKNSGEYQDAHNNSHWPARRKKIARLKQKRVKAQQIVNEVRSDWDAWNYMTNEQKQLWWSYTLGELDDEIATAEQAPPRAPFRGIAEGVARCVENLQC